MSHDRIIRAPADGRLVSVKEIGEKVEQNEIIGYVNFVPIKAGISGCLRGLVRNGLNLKKGRKIGDIDPRGNPRQCFEITPESRKISQGVLEGIRLYQSWRGGPAKIAEYPLACAME